PARLAKWRQPPAFVQEHRRGQNHAGNFERPVCSPPRRAALTYSAAMEFIIGFILQDRERAADLARSAIFAAVSFLLQRPSATSSWRQFCICQRGQANCASKSQRDLSRLAAVLGPRR